ncbi:transporter substrate-binding domain-containing protein [Roseibium denhamense]|uniref:Amino acid ABC transporter substrate-binding protein, PAAT family n=1 Tax=Roseibium denhamense TaxID=76305 RepID=A0ABY1PMR2_9HYPH|nr:transporter substrate-binding domain-containing protein [Roseibium denhamense]MTI05698.1 transporter substrate-binding domain-containing protein [Roseibium denhamense]SMP36904.1 amino acid ABC transporter substrate-binding protein, PAAT family [Roseibium denhamense]
MIARCVIWIGIWLAAFCGPLQAVDILPVVTEDYPPYEMETPREGLRGFDYEVAVEAFARMGYDADIQFLPWKRALNEAEAGTAAGILTCARTRERETFILFSEPISSFTSGFFYRAGQGGDIPNTLEDVAGRSVASVTGYQSLEELKEAGADPVEAPATENALGMLAAGRFDFFYAGRETTDFLIRQLGLSGQFGFSPVAEQPFHFCFSKNYPGVETLVAQFNAALLDMQEDGTYDAIHAKYR